MNDFDVALGPRLRLHERGGIMAEDTGIRGSGAHMSTIRTKPSADLYRMALLFSDQIDYPASTGVSTSDENPFGLVEAGIARLAEVTCRAKAVTAKDVRDTAFAAFAAHDLREPGVWALWRTPGYDPIPEDVSAPHAALRLSLQDLILVPSRQVPLDDVIEFRQRHLDQLREFQSTVDRLCLKLAQGGHDPREIRLETEAFDRAVGRYLDEVRRRNWPLSLGSLEFSMNWADLAREVLKNVTWASFVAGVSAVSLPSLAATLGAGVVASIGIETTRGLRSGPRNSPFEYIASINREFR